MLPKPKNPKNKSSIVRRSASPINLSAHRPPTGKKSDDITWETFKGEKCFSRDTAVTRVAVPGYEPQGQGQRRSRSDLDNADLKSAKPPRIGSLASTASSGSFTSVSSMSSGLSNGNAVKMETNKQQNHTQNSASGLVNDTPNGVNIPKNETASQGPSVSSPSSKPETGTSPPSHIAFGVKVLPDAEELAMFGSTSKEVKAHRSPRDKSPHVNFVDNTPRFPTAELLEHSLNNGEFKFNGVRSGQDQEGKELTGRGALDDLDFAAKHETAYFEELDLEDLTDSQQDLRNLHQRMVDERKEEQRMAEMEKQRLDDILNMCAEYEKQLERERLGIVVNKRDSCDSLKSEGSRNSMSKIKTNGSLTMLATSPTLAHKDGPLTPSSWGRRSSNSSASEEDLSGDNSTIKRRPNNNHVGFDTSVTGINSSGTTIGNNTSGNISVGDSSTSTAYNPSDLDSILSGAIDYSSASTNSASNRHQAYGQSIHTIPE